MRLCTSCPYGRASTSTVHATVLNVYVLKAFSQALFECYWDKCEYWKWNQLQQQWWQLWIYYAIQTNTHGNKDYGQSLVQKYCYMFYMLLLFGLVSFYNVIGCSLQHRFPWCSLQCFHNNPKTLGKMFTSFP